MQSGDERFIVGYRVSVRDGRSVEQHARDITIEQTVEVPEDVIPASHHSAGLTGRVERIAGAGAGQFLVDISYRCDITAFSVPQLFNVLYGNISLKDNIRIESLQFPEALLKAIGGPRFGGEGLRRLLGVHGRPLACTALKPMGLPVTELAALAEAYTAGGVDLVKDDHGITDQPFHPFTERVARCQEAIARANARSGRRTLYFPMVAGGFDQLERQVRQAVREGVRGVLVGPLLVGLDAMRHLAKEYDLAVMAHPALTGTWFHDRSHGMSPEVLLGTLFRLLGADISIFPHAGGRFHFTHEECLSLADALRRPLGSLKPALPCPAGGMNLERIPELIAAYGPESVFLVGGDVLRRGNVEAATRAFMEALRAGSDERLESPATDQVSACEWRSPGSRLLDIQDLLRCSDFHWQGREREAYKTGEECDFRGVVRQELTGRFGEETAFDLRYFEIEPGGFSSLEKHVHEHVIIGVRGQGVLSKGEREFSVGVHDVAYVRPLEVHRLYNRGQEPFGFFCIVDHRRDRPQPA